MTQRDKTTLLYVVGGLAVAGLLFWAVNQLYFGPLARNKKQIASLEEDIERSEKTISLLQIDKKKLNNYYQFLSLPPTPDKAATEYTKFLKPLLGQSKLIVDDFQGPPQSETKPQPPQPGAPKKALHQTLTFKVLAKGTLESLVTALEKMKAAPLAHRVRNLTLDRLDAKDPSARLRIQMTIETLIVNKAEPRDDYIAPDKRLAILDALSGRMGGPIGLAMAMWGASPLGPRGGEILAAKDIERSYDLIHKKNIFLGYVKPPPPVIVKEDPKPPVVVELDPDEAFDMREQIRLVSTDPLNKEAFLRNFAVKEREMRLAPHKIGYNSFKIMNEAKNKTLVEAKVLRIDQGKLYFLVKNVEYGALIYRWHLGADLRQAMVRPLSDEQLEVEGLMEFMPKEEKKKEDKKTDTTKKEKQKL